MLIELQSAALKAVRSLTIREGKGAFGLDESSNAQRVELYLARAREAQKARAWVGANTLVTSGFGKVAKVRGSLIPDTRCLIPEPLPLWGQATKCM